MKKAGHSLLIQTGRAEDLLSTADFLKEPAESSDVRGMRMIHFRSKPSRGRLGSRGFSLIELFMVMAIIGVLAAMLLPAFVHVKKTSKGAKCLSNLKQIGFALTGFGMDHEDRLPWQLTPDLNQYYSGNPSPLNLESSFSVAGIKDTFGSPDVMGSPLDSARIQDRAAWSAKWAGYNPANPIPCEAISYVFIQGGDLGLPATVLAATRNLSTADLATARWVGGEESQPSSIAGLRTGQGHILMADGSVHKSGDADLGRSGRVVQSHVLARGGITAGEPSTLVLCCGQGQGAGGPAPPPAGSTETFSFSFKHVYEAQADKHISSQQNVRKYTEWQPQPTTYWAPSANQPAQITQKFAVTGATTQILLRTYVSSYNFGSSRGGNSIWASKDGRNWELLLDNPIPNRIDSYKSFDGYLPASLLGGVEIYVQIRYLTENSPNSSYSMAQFCRSDAAATADIFRIEITYKK